jgi:hypothetical protein
MQLSTKNVTVSLSTIAALDWGEIIKKTVAEYKSRSLSMRQALPYLEQIV